MGHLARTVPTQIRGVSDTVLALFGIDITATETDRTRPGPLITGTNNDNVRSAIVFMIIVIICTPTRIIGYSVYYCNNSLLYTTA